MGWEFNFNPPVGWTYGPPRTDVIARPDGWSLPNSMHFVPGAVVAVIGTTLAIVPGQLYEVVAYADLSGFPAPCVIRSSYNIVELPNYTFWDDISYGFQFWRLGSFSSTVPNRTFRLWGDNNGALGSFDLNMLWIVESFAMARSRWIAHNALMTAVKTIQGGLGFHTNLGNRVYPRFLNPRQQNVTFPYVCIPLATDAPVITDMQNLVKIEWTVNVYGFVGETDSAENSTTTVRDALYLGEDIWQAILADRTLGGAVQEVEIIPGGESVAGVDSEMWGETRVPLRLTLYADRNDLKP